MPRIQLKYKITLADEQTTRTIQVTSFAGIGGSSCVFSAKFVNKRTIDLAVKFSPFAVREMNNYLLFPQKDIFVPFVGFSAGAIVTRLGVPVVSTIGSKTNVRNLELSDFPKILNRLLCLHENGYCFRDVRLQNIIFIESEPYFVDLGVLAEQNEELWYEGSRETASQRVLTHLVADRNASFVFTPKDDLESLLKTFIIWDYGKYGCWPTGSTYEEYMNFWSRRLALFFHFDPNWSSWNDEKWISCLRALFNASN